MTTTMRSARAAALLIAACALSALLVPAHGAAQKYFTGPVAPDLLDDEVVAHPEAEKRPSKPGSLLFQDVADQIKNGGVDMQPADQPAQQPKAKKAKGKASMPSTDGADGDTAAPASVAPSKFLNTLLEAVVGGLAPGERLLDSQALDTACRGLPQGRDKDITLPRSRVPAWANLTGLVDPAAPSIPLHTLLLAMLPAHPDLISTLACVVENKVVNIARLPDRGARLVYVGAVKKHMRLLTALMEQGASPAYVEPLTGLTTLHAALAVDGLVLDMATSLLRAHSEGEGKVTREEKGMRSVMKTAAASQAAAYPRWLGKITQSLQRHLPAFVGDEVGKAYAAVMKGCTVVDGNGTLLVDSSEPGPLAAMTEVEVKHLRTIANGLSTLVSRMVMEAQLQGALKHAKEGQGKGDKAALAAAGSLDRPTGVGFATASSILASLDSRDMNGRTPLHWAALADNDAAVSHMTLAVRRLVGAAWEHANATTFSTGQKPSLPPKESFVTAGVAAFVASVDGLGFTARKLACALNNSRAAAVLYAAEQAPTSGAGGDAKAALMQQQAACEDVEEEEREAEADRAKAKGPVGIEVLGGLWGPPPGAAGWDAVRPHPSAQAQAAVTEAVRRAKDSKDKGKGKGKGKGKAPAPAAVSVSSLGGQAAAAAAGDATAASSSTSGLPHDCAIPVVRPGDTSPGDFLERFVWRRRPVLVRGSEDGHALVQQWGKDAVLAKAGALPFLATPIPYGRSFGLAGQGLKLTLAEYVHGLQHCSGKPEMAAREAEDSVCVRLANASSEAGASGPLYIFDSPLKAGGASGQAQTQALAAALLQDVDLVPSFLDIHIPVRAALGATVDRADAAVRASRALSLLNTLLPKGKAAAEAALRMVEAGTPAIVLPHAGSDAPEDLPLILPSHPAPAPPSPQVYLGGPGTGAPLHFHKDAWNGLAAGEKRWYLLPPGEARYSTVPAAEWLTTRLANSTSSATRPLECTQLPGDIIYVPHGWGHAVLNTAPGVTVGVAVEFSSPYWPMPSWR